MIKEHFFVSGGVGFIGSHVVDWLISNGNQVTVFDDLGSGRIEHLQHHRDNPHFKLVKGDLLQPPTLNKAAKGHDFVFHLASNPDMWKHKTICSYDEDGACLADAVNTLNPEG